MDSLASSIAFLFANGIFHQSACRSFESIRQKTGDGLDGVELGITLISYVLSFVFGVWAVIAGTRGYNILVWLPAIACWFFAYKLSEENLKQESDNVVTHLSIILSPFLFWLLVYRLT